MKQIRMTLLAMAALACFFSASARADASHPYHVTTVAWIVDTRDNLDMDDRYVTIVGRVTRRIGDEEYWFTDGTGSVRLDSENFDLPVGVRLVIGGRIDQAYLGFGHLEVDVRHWHYAPARKHAATAVASVPAKRAATAAAPASPAPATTPSSEPMATNAPTLTPPAEAPVSNAPAGK